MKRKKHTPDQIIAKLRQAEAERAQGASVEVVCRKLEISTQTYMRLRQQYAGMQVDQVKRLRELEHENTRLEPGQHILDVVQLDVEAGDSHAHRLASRPALVPAARARCDGNHPVCSGPSVSNRRSVHPRKGCGDGRVRTDWRRMD